MVVVSKCPAPIQVSHCHQAIYPAPVSQRTEKAKVSAAVFTRWWKEAWTKRAIGFGVHAGNVDGPVLCRMFNDATFGHDWPTYLSSDNDPLFQYHRWKANLHVLDIDEIKSLPHVPMSHPFVERLIGSVRCELLDHTFFWTVTDLENKLQEYQRHYNESRTHSGRDGTTPVKPKNAKAIDINEYHWQKHCRGLFHIPIAA